MSNKRMGVIGGIGAIGGIVLGWGFVVFVVGRWGFIGVSFLIGVNVAVIC